MKDPNKLERDRRKRDAKDERFLARKRAASRRYAATPEGRIKVQARRKIKHLCEIGKITRPNCERCGTPKAQAHHEDYSRPLDVRWLCLKCHQDEHWRERRATPLVGYGDEK